jgi:hypothetical protein
MSGGHYTHNQRGWASIFPHLKQMMKQADLHIILFSAEPMQSIRSSARTVWKTYWQLLYVQILKSLTLCAALMLSFFFFFPPTICCHYFLHISIYCIWMKDFFGSNGCWHWLLQEAEFEESGEDWAKDLIKVFKRSSPMGLKVTLVSVIMIMRKSHHT